MRTKQKYRQNKRLVTFFRMPFFVRALVFLVFSSFFLFFLSAEKSLAFGYKFEGVPFYSVPASYSGALPVYRFFNLGSGDHLYTASVEEKNFLINTSSGYHLEGTAFYAVSSGQANAVPVYRLYNVTTGDHFYTASEEEKSLSVLNSYQLEGIGFYTVPPSNGNAIPVFRFYSSGTGDHLYTMEEEKNFMTGASLGYKFEGIGFYSVPVSFSGALPVYKFYDVNTGDHFYTASAEEKNFLVSANSGYRLEGIGFYAVSSSLAGAIPVYRFNSSRTHDHFYTASTSEKSYFESFSLANSLGPEITVGLWSNTRDGLQDNPFKIKASKSYNIKDSKGNIIAQIAADTITKVTYDGDKNLKIYNSISDTLASKEVRFDAADGNNATMIFDVYRPDSPFDQYRGKIKLRYSDSTKNIWVINALPLEHYAWGDGELTGTGDMDYNRVMAVSFRTYGYWKMLYSTKYATEGFIVNATPGNQLYYGYDWEKDHSRIKRAAQDTAGIIVKYNGDVAITPYSSWTDGRTRSFEERWGSNAYPWCQSVSDPYGKHPAMTTAELEAAGNHMVGLSAHGALVLATDYGWSWDNILRYYYTGIDLISIY